MEKSPDSRRTDFGKGLYWAAIGTMGGFVTSDTSSTVSAVLSQWAPVAVGSMLGGGALYAGYNVYSRREPGRPRWSNGNPYPLLAPYGTKEHAVFYGRDQEITELADRIRRAKLVHRRFVPVVGPSGCGKSSLLMGGLKPRLQGLRGWSRLMVGPSLTLTRATDPSVELATALVGTSPELDINDLAASLRTEGRAAAEALAAGSNTPKPEHFNRSMRQFRRWRRRTVLLIDQLEELGSAGDSAHGESFMALLEAALASNERLVVVAALRLESLGRFRTGPGSALVKETYSIDQMSWDQLEQVIRGPKEQTKTTIDDSLITRMVEDARKTADPLSELSCVLHELYAEYAADKEITAAEYEDARGYHSAVAKRAEDTMVRLVRMMPEPDTLAERIVLNTWLNFVDVAGPARSSRRVRFGDLDVRQQEIVNAFVEDSKLLSMNEEDGERVVDVRQEAILRGWPRLVAHIDEHADLLNERTDLERLARRWDDFGRQDQFLVKPERARRAAARELLMVGLVGEFLRASSDTDDTVAKSNNAAREAIEVVERDPEQAIRIAESAVALKQTNAARFALYRTWASGLRAALRYSTGCLTSVAWSPDGRLAWGSDDGSVRVWTPGGRVQVLDGHGGPVRCVAWSFDRQLASGSDDRTVRIWDADGVWSDELTDHDAAVTTVAWAPDGRLASGSEDNHVRIWTRERRLLFVLSEHEGPVRSVAWSHDGSRLASGSDDKSVRVWSGDWQVSTLKGRHTGPVRCVAWAPDGSLASGSDDKRVRLVTPQGKVHLLNGHSGRVLSVAWSADGRLVTGSTDTTVRVWGATKSVLYRLSGHGGPVVSVAWSAEGQIASASLDTVRVFGPQKQVLQTLPDHGGPVVSVAWSPDGRLASGSTDESVRVWAASGELVHTHTYDRRSRVVPPLAWSVDGRLAYGAGSTDPQMRMLARDGTEREVTPNSGNAVVSIAWWQPKDRPRSEVKSGRLAIGSNNGLVRVCDANGKRLHELGTRRRTVVRSVAWSPDGRLAAGSDDASVRIWGVDWLEMVLTDHDGPVLSVAWSPDGWLASASDDTTVRIWSPGGRLIRTLDHNGPVRSVAWSHEGWLASGSDDRSVRIWTQFGDLIYELGGHEGSVHSVEWSPDGRLASGSEDRTVKIWPRPVPVEELQVLARNAPGLRNLTPERLRDLMLPGPVVPSARREVVDLGIATAVIAAAPDTALA